MANVKLGTKAVGSVLKLNLNGAPWTSAFCTRGIPTPLSMTAAAMVHGLPGEDLFHTGMG